MIIWILKNISYKQELNLSTKRGFFYLLFFNKVESTPFIFFSNEQYLIDKIRQDAASMGGDVAVVYNMPLSIFFIFSTTHAYYIVYKCNVNNRSSRSTYNTTQTSKQQTQKTTKQNIQYIPSSYFY